MFGQRATGILDWIGNTFGGQQQPQTPQPIRNPLDEYQKRMGFNQPRVSPTIVEPLEFGLEQVGLGQTDYDPTALNMPNTTVASGLVEPIPQPEQPQEQGFMSKVGDYLGNEENRLQMALAFNTMRLEPDDALAQSIENRLKTIRKKKGSTRTAIQLRTMGHHDIASMVERGDITPYQGLQMATKEGKITYQTMSGAQLNKEQGVNTFMPNTMYNVSSKGKIEPVSENLNAYGDTVLKGLAEDDRKVILSANDAFKGIQKTQLTLDKLEKGQPATGIFAPIEQGVNRVFAEFGGKEAVARASDTQILNALLGSDVFPMIKQLGIGARGLDTPAERKFLQEVMTGTLEMTNPALIELTKIRQKYYKRTIDAYNNALQRGDFNNYMNVTGRKLEAIDITPLMKQLTVIKKSDGSIEEF